MENPAPVIPLDIESSLSQGWKTTKSHFLPLLLVVIVVSILSAPSNSALKDIRNLGGENTLWSLSRAAYLLLIVPVFSFSADLMFVQAIRNQTLDFGNLFAGFKNFLDVVLANLLSGVLVIIGIVLFIIPGIWIACRLAFVSILVMDRGLDAVSAIKESWRMTDGYAWTIFLLGIISFFIAILGFICLIVGVFPALIWIKATYAALYEGVRLSEARGKLE